MTSPNTVGLASRSVDLLVAAVLTIGFATVPFWADKGALFLASVVMINAVFALSFNLVFGLTGLVSFGHAAFFATGAYTMGLALQRFAGLPFFASWLVAGLVAGAAAMVVATVALRRASGIYFAILTLALAELVHILIAKSTLLGREDGMTGIKRPLIELGLFRVDLAAGNNLYYTVLCCCVILGAILYLLWHNRVGRLLSAIRQDSERVRFLGVNAHMLSFWTFVASGVFSGMAGALYAPTAQLLTPELAHWSHSALPILFCLVGGVSSFWGPIVGAIVFIGLEHITRNAVGLSDMIIGSALLLVVLIFPGGVIGGLHRIRHAIWRPDRARPSQLEKPQESSV